jgi:sigma-B regulation protein RsbU (phosphoserine phosphatase)
MSATLNALIVEDSEFDARLLLAYLRSGGYEPHSCRVDNAADLDKALKDRKWDIVFSDHNMPNFSSTEALKIVRICDIDVPFLIVSGSIGEDVAVASMKAGAQDYLMKGNMARLVAAVGRELKEAEDRRARRVAERMLLAREEELRIARDVQRLLFPSAMPIVAGYDIAGVSCPAEATGGDYYDFLGCPNGDIYVVIGDVTGHGLGPALLMTDVRAYLRALVLADRPIDDLMAQVRHLLLKDLSSDRFVTMLAARFSPGAGVLEVINAGHPAGYILAASGGIKVELVPTAPALGINGEVDRLVSTRVRIEPGELAVFLTDGILEATSPSDEEFGLQRVMDIILRVRECPSAEIIRTLFDEVRRFSEPDGIQDDITAVVIKRQPI